jgi:hypothetical protein
MVKGRGLGTYPSAIHPASEKVGYTFFHIGTLLSKKLTNHAHFGRC